MIYKRTVLLMLVISLGACSSMYSLVGQQTRSANDTKEPSKSVALEQNAGLEPVAKDLAPLSADELHVQALISQSDLYQGSKRALSPTVKTKVAKALHEFNQGEFVQSEKSIQQVLVNELNISSAVYVLAGDIALANDKQTAAIGYYRAALKANHYNAKAANRLAMQLRQQGKFVEAEKYYTQAINAQPSQAESYRNRAVLYDLYIDEKAKALQDYKTYLALLNYSLALDENASEAILDSASASANTNRAKRLSEPQVKVLKTNIKLVKRWIADVGRQAAALDIANAEASNNTSGD